MALKTPVSTFTAALTTAPVIKVFDNHISLFWDTRFDALYGNFFYVSGLKAVEKIEHKTNTEWVFKKTDHKTLEAFLKQTSSLDTMNYDLKLNISTLQPIIFVVEPENEYHKVDYEVVNKRDVSKRALQHGLNIFERILLNTIMTGESKDVDELDENFFLPDDILDELSPNHQALTDYIVKRDGKDFKYGDLVVPFPRLYHNEGVYIYDGKNVVPLSDEPDDYGTVPKEFPVISKFPVDYWKYGIEHNNLVYVPVKDLLDTKEMKIIEISRNVQDIQEKLAYESMFLVDCSVIEQIKTEYKGKTYIFLIGRGKNRDPEDLPPMSGTQLKEVLQYENRYCDFNQFIGEDANILCFDIEGEIPEE